jgi:hypothetical protein
MQKKWLLTGSIIKNTSCIDSQLQQQLLSEEKRWRAVLERLIAIVLFLSRNNLAFRGTSDKLMTNNNGNFLGLIELLRQFDCVMMDRLRKIVNDDIHNHYCGKIIQNELINLLATKVKQYIVDRALQAKCLSVIVDCIPDVCHVEQLSITISFVVKLSRYTPWRHMGGRGGVAPTHS